MVYVITFNSEVEAKLMAALRFNSAKGNIGIESTQILFMFALRVHSNIYVRTYMYKTFNLGKCRKQNKNFQICVSTDK